MAVNEASNEADKISAVQTSPATIASSPANSVDLDDDHHLYKQSDDQELDPAESKRVLRKLDIRIVPILFLIYLLQYLDKNGINYASVYGLQKGTNLHGQDYSWLGSIFYFGYLWAQYPAGYFLQRLRVGKVIGATTIAWGIILITTPACSSFAGIAVNRFLRGSFESVVNPGFILIMSIWYTSLEQPLRLEAYYCTNGIATMFGGLIGYAVGHITTGLPRWMYVFIIFGSVSIALGILALVMLPDLSSTAKFLTDAEKVIAAKRVSANRQGIKNRHFKSYQMWQTFRDPKTWILFIMAVGAQIPNSAITQFTSLVIQSFNVDTLGSQYLQIPGGAVQFVALLGGGIICSRWPNLRCITMIVANTICIVGSGLLVAAILFTGYCVGNIIGPQTFKSSEAPRYHSAYVEMLVGYTIKLVAIIVLYVYMFAENKRRDREAAVSGVADLDEEKEAIERGMHDVTELDNKGFRYTV
ncbi:uncharacterized protein A1O5_13241 [Cladophialophora psammophila CBS 110553]|uniref:Major facilitator superfamily (MFS) profile domain-containing protein n=1 Tax=Cladophialophora psammophila CBS 110553 TaxID=1182543 RepID=W9W4R2_9EURO|nr:uncharacterized protein A1O5_13241 [Cladophialophora psammophila CBS 110553]EXJ53569.1 hypothetical protein A1O5_13241 [Cladophialophora psammophila CBS 110553]